MLVLDGQRAKRSREEVPGPGVHGVQVCTGVYRYTGGVQEQAVYSWEYLYFPPLIIQE